MKKTTIFVYGTLRRGFGNHSFLNQSTFKGNAITVEKFTMFCSGQIPFVSRSQAISTIVGEVYEVDEQTLRNLDTLEGCIPKSSKEGGFESNSWYTREQIAVQYIGNDPSDEIILSGTINSSAIEEQSSSNSAQLSASLIGTTEQVWIYFNEKETQHRLIPTGDFMDRDRFILPSNRKWYFAYGSNMNLEQMLGRNAFFTRRIRGWVDGYRLVFNKIASSEPGYGKANIIEDYGFEVMGVLYEVQEEALSTLDRFEGVSGLHYERKEMRVQTVEFGIVTAVVYLAHSSKIQNGLQPTESYAANFYAGLDILGEEGKSYLDDAIQLARVSDDPKFVMEEDIPYPTEEQLHNEKLQNLALPVLIDGYPAKIAMTTNGWSDKIVVFCEPETVNYLVSKGLYCGEDGVFGTGKFRILRRGILELTYQPFSIEKC
ncbi:MAG: gamma-glutamylcyclotransferase [Bacteroidota bacterium]